MAHSKERLDVRIRRVYPSPARRDGARIPVDRIWPRGLRKSDAAIERWIGQIAPSTALRQWFAHDPTRWEPCQRRHRPELKGQAQILDELRGVARQRPLTLVYCAHDGQHNPAVVLRAVLLRRSSQVSP